MAEPGGYVDRRRRRRGLWLLGIAVAVISVVLSARSVGTDDPCRSPSAAPAAELALLPAGLSFDGIGTITSVRKDDLHFTVRAVATAPVEEATVLVQDAVTAAGYRPGGMDSEGVEAEVFFTTQTHAAGRARLLPAACEGRSDVDLVLLDLDAENVR